MKEIKPISCAIFSCDQGEGEDDIVDALVILYEDGSVEIRCPGEADCYDCQPMEAWNV